MANILDAGGVSAADTVGGDTPSFGSDTGSQPSPPPRMPDWVQWMPWDVSDATQNQQLADDFGKQAISQMADAWGNASMQEGQQAVSQALANAQSQLANQQNQATSYPGSAHSPSDGGPSIPPLSQSQLSAQSGNTQSPDSASAPSANPTPAQPGVTMNDLANLFHQVLGKIGQGANVAGSTVGNAASNLGSTVNSTLSQPMPGVPQSPGNTLENPTGSGLVNPADQAILNATQTNENYIAGQPVGLGAEAGAMHEIASGTSQQAGNAIAANLPGPLNNNPLVSHAIAAAVNPETVPALAAGALGPGLAAVTGGSVAHDLAQQAGLPGPVQFAAGLAGGGLGAGAAMGAEALAGGVSEAAASRAANIADYAKTYIGGGPAVEEAAPGVAGMGGAAPLPKIADVILGPQTDPQAAADTVTQAIKQLFNTSDYASAPSTRGAIYINADMRRSWDAASGMLQDAVNRIVPDAAERSRIVTEYNVPEARATWTPQMRAAAQVWDNAQNATFSAAKDAGVIDNYMPEYMSRIAKQPQGGGPGMANFSDYTPASNQRVMPTYEDFSNAIKGMGLEPVTDLGDVVNAHIDSLGRSVENARFVSFLKSNTESDGRPTVWAQQGAAPGDYVTVPVKGLSRFVYSPSDNENVAGILHDVPLRIHPDAAPAFKDLVPQTYGPIDNFISKFNRLATWGIMYNPLIHSSNVAGPGMAGSTWENALTGGSQAWRTGMAAMRGQQGDVLDLIRSGLNTRANQEARQALFDSTVAREPALSDAIQNMPVLGGLKQGSDSLLWDGIVAPYQIGTAMLLRDALQQSGPLADKVPSGLADALSNLPLMGAPFRGGLDPTSASRVAARAANTMFGELPSETMSTSARMWAGRALFARNWTLGLARTYGGALGVYKDAALSPDEQAAMRQVMGDYVARSILMGGASHEALNIALSGHSSLSNADGHKLDIAVKNPSGGESYYSYPLFKQIQDAMGLLGILPPVHQALGKGPISEAYGKLSPALHAASDVAGTATNYAPGLSEGAGKALPLYTAKDGPFVAALKAAAEIGGDVSPVDIKSTTANGPEQIEGPMGLTYTPALKDLSGPQGSVDLAGAARNAVGIHERGNPSTIASDKALQMTTDTVNQLRQQGVFQKLTPAEQQRVTQEIHAAYTKRISEATFGTATTPSSEMKTVSRRLDATPMTDAQRAEIQLQASKALRGNGQ